jgi:glycosyltransferase involved in cell wall biosynthesis
MNLDGQVTLHGWIDQPTEWLKQIDIFVSNSYWEGLQNALVEAMAAGCYCLAHCWNGSEELLNDRYLYESPRELHRKVAAFCDLAEAEKWAHQREYRETITDRFSLKSMLSLTRCVIQEARRETSSGKPYLNPYRSTAD